MVLTRTQSELTLSHFIDRRLNPKNKSTVNRARFIERFRHQIRKAVSDAVSRRSIKETDRGESINIPTRDISEPNFRHGAGGQREAVHPGNKDFLTGDRFARPRGGSGRGNRASNDGEGVDSFTFELSRDEFLDFFFEDLELPDLVKTELSEEPSMRSEPAGFVTEGNPSSLHIVRSMRQSVARRKALGSPLSKRRRELEAELEALLEETDEDDPRVIALREQISTLRQRITKVPFLDKIDLRYQNRIQVPLPSSQAVMFCLMDVSGSMDQFKKDLAKRFFILLYLFLQRHYEHTDVVFIRHHTVAKEVGEEEFFYSRETGGTVVSSALQLMLDIIRERYPTDNWNIYGAQASDGDNWPEDIDNCQRLLDGKIMPLVQFFAYVEIASDAPQGLWEEYERVSNSHRNFAMQQIDGPADIYPVFRKLFEKRQA